MIITKIHIHNTESFQDNKQHKVKRTPMFGHAFLPLLVASAVIAVSSESIQQAPQRPDLDSLIPSTTVTISVDELNDMDILLNDHDCSDTFFDEVVSVLREDGIEVTTTKDCQNINEDSSTVITLDQQYSAGPETIIFSPYNNARIGHSDSLALSMQKAFEQDGVSVQTISCGQSGFQEDENGNVLTQFPTDTEKAIDDDCDSSFVTISLGTQIQSPKRVAKDIENGLVRQKYYLNSDDNQTDLIYRANSSDSMEVVANYFGTDVGRLKKYNALQSDEFKDSQTVINPYVSEMKAFDSFGSFQVADEKEKSY